MTASQARAIEYVLDETVDLPDQANEYGPWGRCWRVVEPAGGRRRYDRICQEPAVNDVGLCGDHLAELAAC